MEKWSELNVYEKLAYVLAGVVAIPMIVLWAISLRAGETAFVRDSVLWWLVFMGLPLLAYLVVPGSKQIRAVVALGLMVAGDVTSAHVLGLRDRMFLVENWETAVVLGLGLGLIIHSMSRERLSG